MCLQTFTPLRKGKNEKSPSLFIEKIRWFSNIDFESFKKDNIHKSISNKMQYLSCFWKADFLIL